MTLSLARLMAEQVLLTGLTAFQLARGGDAKAFPQGLVRLDLGHNGPRKQKRAPGCWPGFRGVFVVPGSRNGEEPLYTESRKAGSRTTGVLRLRRQHRGPP